MNEERLESILTSGVWGTCGPIEKLATKKLCDKLSEPGRPVFTVLTYSYSAAEEILSIAKRMGLISEDDPAYPMDFGFAGAVVTPSVSLYEFFYQIHHCGHRPGIGATVDLSEETIVGGDMRITEWQAGELLESLEQL
ncbi:MAG: hypothetical protein J5589_01700 [Firmicutes bacterium]|nr:hypothetical protein [Bacillota bacterium]